MKPRLLDLFCGAGGAAMGSVTERAWAAGFFDGEGCVSPHFDRRPGRTPALQLSIEQNDPRPLERFAMAVGYSGHANCRKTIRPPANKPMYRIAMGHAATVCALEAMWPYLSDPKREQALRAYEQIT